MGFKGNCECALKDYFNLFRYSSATSIRLWICVKWGHGEGLVKPRFFVILDYWVIKWLLGQIYSECFGKTFGLKRFSLSFQLEKQAKAIKALKVDVFQIWNFCWSGTFFCFLVKYLQWSGKHFVCCHNHSLRQHGLKGFEILLLLKKCPCCCWQFCLIPGNNFLASIF